MLIENLLKTLTLASEMNASITMTEKLLRYVGSLLAQFTDLNNDWPTTFASAKSILKATGLYNDPEHHKICFNNNTHPAHYYVLDDTQVCPDCDELPEINRYYLPLRDKIKRWFVNVDLTQKMLGHWKNRIKWLGKTGATYPLEEIWDGYRFKELQWFWDPNARWPIPHKCAGCDMYINLKDLNVTTDELQEIQCFHCNTKQAIRPKIVCGDPRNIGLIGHWDGWSPKFGRGVTHSTGNLISILADTSFKQ